MGDSRRLSYFSVLNVVRFLAYLGVFIWSPSIRLRLFFAWATFFCDSFPKKVLVQDAVHELGETI